MKITLVVLTLFPEFAFSQQTAIQTVSGVNSSDTVTKIVRVRYGNPRQLAGLAASGVPVTVNADDLLHVIVLKGSANAVTSAEQTIRELDVPATAQTLSKSKDVELVVSVIGGSDKAETLLQDQAPEAIAPVIKQLQAVFPYRNYQILSSMLLRSSEGAKAENGGVMKSLTNLGNHPHPRGYTVAYDEVRISSEEGKPVIHLRNFSFRTSIPTPVPGTNDTQFQPTDVGIKTNVDLREGQKVVAGKANIDNSDLALFVVLMARVVE